MIYSYFFALFAGFAIAAKASPLLTRPSFLEERSFPPYHNHTRSPLHSTTIGQLYTNETFFENLAVRPNGDLLATLFEPLGVLYKVQEPYSNTSRKLSVLHNFNDDADPEGGFCTDAYTAVLGIAELTGREDESYIVSGGRFVHGESPEDGAVPGSMAAWEVRFAPSASSNNSMDKKPKADQVPEVQVRQIASLPDAGLLNGVAAVPGVAAVLIADNARGIVHRVNVTTGESQIVLDVPETRPVAFNSTGYAINGIKISDDGNSLYWTNSDRVSIYRTVVDALGYPVAGQAPQVELVADLKDMALSLDDFALDRQGDVWVVTHFDNMLIRVGSGRQPEVVLGAPGEMTIAGCTAAQFGRTERDRGTLYMTTNGGSILPVNGTGVEPAKIVAADIPGMQGGK